MFSLLCPRAKYVLWTGRKNIKAFRQRTVSIPCKWFQCIEVNANKKKNGQQAISIYYRM